MHVDLSKLKSMRHLLTQTLNDPSVSDKCLGEIKRIEVCILTNSRRCKMLRELNNNIIINFIIFMPLPSRDAFHGLHLISSHVIFQNSSLALKPVILKIDVN